MHSTYPNTKTRSSRAIIFIPCLACFLFFFVSATMAQGDLLITPKRLVFEGAKRSDQLNLANIGKDTVTFLISFIQIRMNADGGFEKILQPDSGQNFADKNIRFFPRSVTLAPNEAQTVKIQLTKTNQLTAGEYRSHLYFRAVPKEIPLGEKPSAKDSSISVRLIPIFGISIPVIIREGVSTTSLKISDVSLEAGKDQAPNIKLVLNRTGNMSAYGDLLIDHIAPDGKVTHVGAVNGLAVYTPNTSRHFQLLLDKNAGVNYSSGKIHLLYSDMSAKLSKLAEGEILLH